MAQYKVDLPEGGFVNFDAADNASDAELQKAARVRVAAHQKNLAAETAKMRADYDPVKDMSGYDKVAANLGAGASNLITGAQGLGTKMFGSDADKAAMDADVLEKRERDAHLAQGTTGGSALQLAGEILPTLLVPAGGLARGAGAVLTRTLGEKIGGTVASKLGMRALAQGGSTVADAAMAGGLSGALAPTTSDESTLGRIAAGAALGGAVPWLGAKVGQYVRGLNPWGSGESAAARVVGEQLGGTGSTQAERAAVASRVADQIRRLPREAAADAGAGAAQGAEAGAGGAIGGAAGDAFDPAAALLQRASAGRGGGARPPVNGIPLSTAAQLNSPELAWLEIGSRARNAGQWAQHDTDYAQGLVNSLRGATQEGGDIAARRATRNANWQSGMQSSLENADHDVFAAHVGNLRAEVEDALTSAEARNPKIRAMYRQLLTDLDESGGALSPEHLQQIRANFNEKASAFNPNPSAYATAPREAPAVGNMIGRLDDILEDTTGGAWSGVRSNYARDARALDEAKAAQRLHEKFYDEAGNVRGTASGIAGDLPTLTEAGFNRATSGGRDAGMYSREAQAQIDAMQNAIRAKNIVQRVKTSGTGGGGSATAPTWYAAQDAGKFGQVVSDTIRKVPVVGDLAAASLQGLGNVSKWQRDKMLSDALQNPQTMLRLLERVEASGQPLNEAQRAALTALRGASTATVDATHR